jgi:predicted Rossmann fold flavoprotein
MKKQSNQKAQGAFDVIVIGGGASGMMAAGRAGERGRKVLLLEKNLTLGTKLSITGGGRCNITNVEPDIRKLLRHYGDAEQFLYSPFAEFDNQHTIDFFTKRGLPIKVEDGNRAFPVTERAPDVTRVMEKYVTENRVTIQTGESVTRITIEGNRLTSVETKKGVYTGSAIILATGGQSHPETGSTGDGFEWLRELGHAVVPPTPGIVPLVTEEKWAHAMTGTAFPLARTTFFCDDKKSFTRKGKLLFTHFGLSGPVILNSASKVSDLLHEGKVTVKIDLFPEEDHHILEARILALFDAHKNKSLKNTLADILPPAMIPAFLSLIETDGETKVHSVTKETRKRIMHLLKALPLTINGLMGYDRAVVADGGITLREIDTKTMCSTIYENLFVTGDLLNIHRPSGGFSLQLCWTTGWVAGSNA